MANSTGKYTVTLSPAAQRDMKKLKNNQIVLASIDKTIQSLANNPRPAGAEPLKGSTSYKKRDGEYRILYKVDDAEADVTIERVRDRKEVYKH